MQHSISVFARCKSAKALALPADEPNTFDTQAFHSLGRAVDGRLARSYADHGGRGTRGDARAQRVSDYGGPLAAGLLAAVPADPPRRRFCRTQDVAAAAPCR